MGREILIVKNITREGPGLIGEIIKEYGIKYRIIDVSKGQSVKFLKKYGAVIILGGPDSANDLNAKTTCELALIREALLSNIPYLGICLGLQMFVKAAGGKVVQSPVKEVGFRDQNGDLFRVELTDEGMIDPLFRGLADTFDVFHLHGETVIPTDKMKLLASGKYCRNQIVKAGTNAYGIQCHFEITREMFEKWIEEDPDLQRLDKKQLQSDFETLKEHYHLTGRQLFTNFLKIARLI